jgi:hypothetical protein
MIEQNRFIAVEYFLDAFPEKAANLGSKNILHPLSNQVSTGCHTELLYPVVAEKEFALLINEIDMIGHRPGQGIEPGLALTPIVFNMSQTAQFPLKSDVLPCQISDAFIHPPFDTFPLEAGSIQFSR